MDARIAFILKYHAKITYNANDALQNKYLYNCNAI